MWALVSLRPTQDVFVAFSFGVHTCGKGRTGASVVFLARKLGYAPADPRMDEGGCGSRCLSADSTLVQHTCANASVPKMQQTSLQDPAPGAAKTQTVAHTHLAALPAVGKHVARVLLAPGGTGHIQQEPVSVLLSTGLHNFYWGPNQAKSMQHCIMHATTLPSRHVMSESSPPPCSCLFHSVKDSGT
jgi:hypothetical protein